MPDPDGNVVADVRVEDGFAELEAAVEYALGTAAEPARVIRVLAVVTRVLARRGWRADGDFADAWARVRRTRSGRGGG